MTRLTNAATGYVRYENALPPERTGTTDLLTTPLDLELLLPASKTRLLARVRGRLGGLGANEFRFRGRSAAQSRANRNSLESAVKSGEVVECNCDGTRRPCLSRTLSNSIHGQ